MNVETNELIRVREGQETPPGFEPVPEGLNRAARRTLGHRDSVVVSRTSGGRLSRWAAQRRKAKRKMAAASRKRNRG